MDSENLPLNTPFNRLKGNEFFQIFRNKLISSCLSFLSDAMKDEEKGKKFYEQFSKNIKLGIHEDTQNRKKLSELLRFSTSKSGGDVCSLKDYVSRMKENQKHIYYITGNFIKNFMI